MSPRWPHTYPRLVLSDRGDAQFEFTYGLELGTLIPAVDTGPPVPRCIDRYKTTYTY